MATQTYPVKYDEFTGERTPRRVVTEPRHPVMMVVHTLASLKLTVVLLAMSIFLVLVGTLAQVDMGMWDVLEKYFASYFTWINIRVFFPPSFFPTGPRIPDFYFPFFGGASIGLAMIVNLLAAHLLRFKVQAKNSRLVAGLVTLLAGIAVTWAVIGMGHKADGIQDQPFFQWTEFWLTLKIGLAIGWFFLWYPLVRLLRSSSNRFIEAVLISFVIDGLAALLLYIYSVDAQLDVPSMRILWQLLQGSFAALVLLAGCLLLFRKRAGIVLIHAGILLMMFGQYWATVFNVEQQMTIRQGQTQNYAYRRETPELAIIDASAADHDNVVVVPAKLLQKSLRKETVIADEQLPFDVKVLSYYRNSALDGVQNPDQNPATTGLGQRFAAIEKPVNSGASAGTVDLPSAYVQLRDKSSGRVLGTYLLSYWVWAAQSRDFGPDAPFFQLLKKTKEEVKVDGKTYQISLRPQRFYKTYTVTCIDAVREDYAGTDEARDFASIVRIVDQSKGINQEARIWMNNPLRLAGETFYQSEMDPLATSTTLSVVRNVGWMIPYVSCMIVAVGLVAHFWGALMRFLVRREQAIFAAASTQNPYEPVVEDARRRPKRKAVATPQPADNRLASHLLLASVLILGALWMFGPMIPRSGVDDRGLDMQAFGELPVLAGGRVLPLDSLARNTLRTISNSESFVDRNGERQPAIRWLLDLISGSEKGLEHRVIRIENLDVLASINLERRKGLRYSLKDLEPGFEEIDKQVKIAAAVAEEDKTKLTIYQRKMLELKQRLNVCLELMHAFRTPNLASDMPVSQLLGSKDAADAVMAELDYTLRLNAQPEMQEAPRAVPAENGEWTTASKAWALAMREKIAAAVIPDQKIEEKEKATFIFHDMMLAYRNGEAKGFNAALQEFQKYVNSAKPPQYQPAKVTFEAYFNRSLPFFHAQWAYVFAGVLAALAWLGWSKPLNRASFWLIVLALIVHTAALGARMYISGRPPVTNLYSSAIFIGWAGAIFGIAIEILYRLGIGNVLAAAAGFATLKIASYLAITSGETMGVLQAVLDTQFWLSTHVVTVTLGYAATFVAGILALIYVTRGVFTKGVDYEMGRSLTRMIYGTLCFALLFSFVGTVLGGLWADDSWGRFWGWDPKENGALIIVLWNALVLHARWDRMVGDRGLALLAIGGNVTTAWSWFGVNELGVGLHSYGFTEGVLLALGVFVVSQFVMIGIGLIPRQHWRSGAMLASAD